VDGVNLSVAAGTVIEDNGAIELANSGALVSQAIDVQAGGALAGNGMIKTNALLVSGGTLRPGVSVGLLGHLDVEGNYVQHADGTLLVDVQGSEAGERDTIDITGLAALSGTLRIDGSNLALTPDTTIEIITAGGLSGKFDSVDWIGDEALRSFYYVSYDYDEGTIGLSSERDLDMNGDQDADPIDLTDIRLFVTALMNEGNGAFWAQCGAHCVGSIFPQQHGDFNDNGRVDFDDIGDFQAWVGNMGVPPDEVSAAFERAFNNVPEPSSAMLAICGIVIRLAGRRRRYDERRLQTAGGR
jgi:hypothetical protein